MRAGPAIVVAALWCACGEPVVPDWSDAGLVIADSLDLDATGPEAVDLPHGTLAHVPFPLIDDNIRHDTLLIQVAFDLGDGTFVMVGSNVEDSFEGLRLYRYSLLPDSNAQVLAVSAPAYDSWTMLPTFFRPKARGGSFIVLANFGERQSWGQKVMLLDSTGFKDLGFIDAAWPERMSESDSSWIRLGSIAPFTTIASSEEGLVFSFTCDSLHLFDDLRGGVDVMLPAARVRYRLNEDGFALGVDGRFILPPVPG